VSAGVAAETRKVVTVFFIDLTESTALGERLGPELLRRVMWRYFDVVQGVLERHDGTVEKFVGDAVMAVFGVPVVHEDAALRAIRAAAEIGDAVNVAARLEQAASPGEVLIGAATYAAEAQDVHVEPAPPVDAKGKSLPLAAYRLVGLRPDVPAFARPISTPFVGRREELGRLRAAFDDAITRGPTKLATIVGTPGIGKSRLARELLDSLPDEARVLVGRCTAYGAGIPCLPLADVVRDAGDISCRVGTRWAAPGLYEGL
jgi:hypothetical protein